MVIRSQSGIVRVLFTSHQCRALLSLLFVEPVPEANAHHSKVWLCKKAFQGLKISLHAWGIHSSEKIGAMGYEQLKSDPSMCVVICEKGKDDSILLHHIDDPKSTSCETLSA